MQTHPPSPGGALALRIIAMAAVCGAVTYFLGKDSNWDIFNYHLYIAHAFLNQDLWSDFMATGLQRYFNPIGYLPFYWMVQADWHSLAIGIILAAFHSLSLVLLWEICARYLFKSDARPGLLAGMSVMLAAMSPVFLGTLGGTYLDQITLVPVFGSLLLLCFALERPNPTNMLPLLAGGLIGISAALKLTNLIYVASAGIALLVGARFSLKGWKKATWYGAGAILGALFAGGWWSFKVYQEFGNPFFPLFNNIFRSPDFAPVSLSLSRFTPASIVDALTFPFDMASSHKWVYVENAAADVRFALLAILALILLCIHFLRRKPQATLAAAVDNAPRRMIVAFFVVSFPVWLATSGNGRYALPILLLVAPLLTLTVRAIIPARNWFFRIMFLILAVQGVVISMGENPRWDTGSWTAKWVDVDVPPKLKDSPYGFLSVGANSNSFLALHFHPDSRLVSMLGVYPLALENPGGGRVRAFISSHAGRLRSLGSLKAMAYRDMLERNKFGDYLQDMDGRFAMWDLRTDPADCVPIKFSVTPNEDAIVISCGLLPGNPRRAGMLPEWERYTRVFDRIEKACPTLFSPAGGYTNKRGVVWNRLYINTDVMLKEFNGRITFSQYSFGPFDVDMGSLEDWETGTATWACQKPKPHWK